MVNMLSSKRGEDLEKLITISPRIRFYIMTDILKAAFQPVLFASKAEQIPIGINFSMLYEI